MGTGQGPTKEVTLSHFPQPTHTGEAYLFNLYRKANICVILVIVPNECYELLIPLSGVAANKNKLY